MPKKRKSRKGDADAAIWAKPEMAALDELTKRLVQVPKSKVDKKRKHG